MDGKEQTTGLHCCQNEWTEVRETACWIQLLRSSDLWREQLPCRMDSLLINVMNVRP